MNENTPVEFIDTCYHVLDCTLMAEMADAIGRPIEAATTARAARIAGRVYQDLPEARRHAHRRHAVGYVLALSVGLIPQKDLAVASATLAARIAKNDHRMATGFLGTKSLLPRSPRTTA